MPIITEEIKALMDLVEPYMNGCKLRNDAPENVKEADKKIEAWFYETMDGVQ